MKGKVLWQSYLRLTRARLVYVGLSMSWPLTEWKMRKRFFSLMVAYCLKMGRLTLLPAEKLELLFFCVHDNGRSGGLLLLVVVAFFYL